jgi:hypothetical protein
MAPRLYFPGFPAALALMQNRTAIVSIETSNRCSDPMSEIFQENPALVRFGAFVIVFLLVALAEWRLPRRMPTQSRLVRWYSNLGIHGIDSLALC